MASADDQPSDLELMETLDEVRASADYAIYQVVEEDAAVIERIAAEQRAELEKEIEALKVEAERKAAEARELAGEVPFWREDSERDAPCTVWRKMRQPRCVYDHALAFSGWRRDATITACRGTRQPCQHGSWRVRYRFERKIR